MNQEIRRQLHDMEIPLLSNCQLRFIDDVDRVILEQLIDEGPYEIPDEEELEDVMSEIEAIQENLNVIIQRLRGGIIARKRFLTTYPKWKKIRGDGIEKLRELAVSINNDRFNCNVSKLVGYSTSAVGGLMTLASAIMIPFSFGLTTPLFVAGCGVTAAGCSTSIGTSVTETVLLNSNVKKAQEIVSEDKKCFEDMNNWLEHAADLDKKLSELLSMNVVKDIAKKIEALVRRGFDMQNELRRLNFVEKAFGNIVCYLPQNLQALPLFAWATVISILVTFFVLLLNSENRLVFDCAALTIRSVAGVASLIDSSMDVLGLTRVFADSAKGAGNVAKAVTRGGVAALGIALDVAGIVLTSIDVHKGSLSPEAKKIEEVAEELENEAGLLEEVYENVN